MAGRGPQDRTSHPGLGQIETHRRHLLAGGLRLRYDRRQAYVPCAKPRSRRPRRKFSKPRPTNVKDGLIRYRARKQDCETLPPESASAVRPNLQRKVLRSVHEAARHIADIRKTDPYASMTKPKAKAIKVEYAVCPSEAIHRTARMMRLRGPQGATEQFQARSNRPEPPQTGQVGARAAPGAGLAIGSLWMLVERFITDFFKYPDKE